MDNDITDMNKLATDMLRKKIDLVRATELINGSHHVLEQYLSADLPRTLPRHLPRPLPLMRYHSAICKFCGDRMSIPESIMKQIGRRAICYDCTDVFRGNARFRWFNESYLRQKKQLVDDRVMSLIVCRRLKCPWIIGWLIGQLF